MNSTTFFAASAVALLAAATTSFADDDLPKRPEFARYEPMMNRSPFAVATAVAAPAPVSNFAKDLYVANAAHSPNGDLVTIASSTDKNLKLYLTTKEPVDGYSISNIEWSDRVGATKVTISKDGQFGTIGFNQALIAAPVPANAGTVTQAQPQQIVPQAGNVPQPGGFGSGMIKPAPIPMLPTPPPRVRTIIQRTPTVPTPQPADAEE
jgi:hypothetical protein